MKRVLLIGLFGAAIAGFGTVKASAAPLTLPAAPAAAVSQAEQMRYPDYYEGRRYNRRYYRSHNRYYGPRYYGYRGYGGPYLYGGIGLPFIGLSIGGGRRHHRHW